MSSTYYTEADLARIAAQPGYAIEGKDTAATPSAQPSNGRQPTKTELLFEAEYLERRLEDGLTVFWMREPKIRMVGQSYKPDYIELVAAPGANGAAEVRFYEVKGSFALGSESRSSVKIRWAAAEFANTAIRFFWVKRCGIGWKMREVKVRREKAR